jgi:hypothetical protein
MLKKAPSSVLASLYACDVPQGARLSFSLAAALLDDLFEHPEQKIEMPDDFLWNRTKNLNPSLIRLQA